MSETLVVYSPLGIVALLTAGLFGLSLWRETRYIRRHLAPWWRRQGGRRG